jgi:hypothetical protein
VDKCIVAVSATSVILYRLVVTAINERPSCQVDPLYIL